jgi:hypothetical protein
VEQFQKIEALTGQRMEKYECEEEAALLLLERVAEAQKLATMQAWLLPGSFPLRDDRHGATGACMHSASCR